MVERFNVAGFKKVLVPLDGSPLAEEVLPLAAHIARDCNASITLLYVILPSSYISTSPIAPLTLEGKTKDDLIACSQAYLQRVKDSECLRHTQVDVAVELGGVPLTIVSFAQRHKIDVIVMRSHGESGFKRWLLGSVAQQILRHSPVPVLIVREDIPSSTLLTEAFMHAPRILVPLDGSLLAEAALLPAAQLCVALASPRQGAIHITRVVQRLSTLVRGQAKARVEQMDREIKNEAEIYLQHIVQRFVCGDLAAWHLNVSSSVVVYSDAEEIVARIVEESNCIGDVPGFSGCDIIAMATHGRRGFQHMLWGSFTEEVFDATRQPLLIVLGAESALHKQAGHNKNSDRRASVLS